MSGSMLGMVLHPRRRVPSSSRRQLGEVGVPGGKVIECFIPLLKNWDLEAMENR